MKRLLTYCLAVSLLLSMFSMSGLTAFADERLITVGGKTVTETMTLDDIVSLFGEPKLTTPSFFGGDACTFYGENYDDYLYIETFADGTVASYGSVSDDFETDAFCFGDIPDNYVRRGYEATDSDGKLFGIMRYRNFPRGQLSAWYDNVVENNYNLNLHAVEMWNAVSYLYGYNTPTSFDETAFYTNMQLGENGSDLFEYCTATNQSSYVDFCRSGSDWMIESGSYYPNPFMFADHAASYTCTTGYYSAFMCYRNSDGKPWSMTGFVSPLFFKERETVDYTAEEETLLKTARELYAESVRLYNEGVAEGYYDITPQFETLPLTAGLLKEKVAVGAVGYLNAIRAGAGLPLLTYSPELSEAAQCKSTLTMYMSVNGIDCDNPHFPPQPEGVDDELYEKSQLGSSENLFMCGLTSASVVGSLKYALDDSFGDGQYYLRGHRYNLINPTWKTIGVGNTERQGAHKTAGYQAADDVEIVAWPSKGIMLSETGFQASQMFTCRFYNGMSASEQTTVTVELLNSGDTWTITSDALTDEQEFWTNGRQISYTDRTIPFAVGNVYLITFDHLTDMSGNDVSYSYRSVYETAWQGDGAGEAAVALDKTTLPLAVGDTEKLTATVTPADVENKLVRFQSSDETVATVNENGFVTAVGEGTAVITATAEANGAAVSCEVTVATKGNGDTDASGTLNITDAVQAYYHVNGKITLEADAQKRADVAQLYGTLNIQDAVTIYYTVNGKMSI